MKTKSYNDIEIISSYNTVKELIKSYPSSYLAKAIVRNMNEIGKENMSEEVYKLVVELNELGLNK